MNTATAHAVTGPSHEARLRADPACHVRLRRASSDANPDRACRKRQHPPHSTWPLNRSTSAGLCYTSGINSVKSASENRHDLAFDRHPARSSAPCITPSVCPRSKNRLRKKPSPFVCCCAAITGRNLPHSPCFALLGHFPLLRFFKQSFKQCFHSKSPLFQIGRPLPALN